MVVPANWKVDYLRVRSPPRQLIELRCNLWMIPSHPKWIRIKMKSPKAPTWSNKDTITSLFTAPYRIQLRKSLESYTLLQIAITYLSCCLHNYRSSLHAFHEDVGTLLVHTVLPLQIATGELRISVSQDSVHPTHMSSSQRQNWEKTGIGFINILINAGKVYVRKLMVLNISTLLLVYLRTEEGKYWWSPIWKYNPIKPNGRWNDVETLGEVTRDLGRNLRIRWIYLNGIWFSSVGIISPSVLHNRKPYSAFGNELKPFKGETILRNGISKNIWLRLPAHCNKFNERFGMLLYNE